MGVGPWDWVPEYGFLGMGAWVWVPGNGFLGMGSWVDARVWVPQYGCLGNKKIAEAGGNPVVQVVHY